MSFYYQNNDRSLSWCVVFAVVGTTQRCGLFFSFFLFFFARCGLMLVAFITEKVKQFFFFCSYVLAAHEFFSLLFLYFKFYVFVFFFICSLNLCTIDCSLMFVECFFLRQFQAQIVNLFNWNFFFIIIIIAVGWLTWVFYTYLFA